MEKHQTCPKVDKICNELVTCAKKSTACHCHGHVAFCILWTSVIKTKWKPTLLFLTLIAFHLHSALVLFGRSFRINPKVPTKKTLQDWGLALERQSTCTVASFVIHSQRFSNLKFGLSKRRWLFLHPKCPCLPHKSCSGRAAMSLAKETSLGIWQRCRNVQKTHGETKISNIL